MQSLWRLRVAGLVAASGMVAALIVAPPAAAAPVLVSQGKPATASSVENPAQGAAKAFDGNDTTRWGSNFADNQWIMVDLGTRHMVDRVVLKWEGAYAKAYEIRLSEDGVNWQAFYSTVDGKGGTETVNVFGTGRYVRMHGITRATAYGFSLWEMQVYGSSGRDCESVNGTATASSTENTAMGPAKAIDGMLSTRWTSNWTDNEWIRIDLGQVRGLCRISLAWEAAYGKAYQIRVSNDAQTWTTIFSKTNGTGGTELIDVDASGRYVEMKGTLRGTPYGYSLWEFQINPNPGGPAIKWSDEFNAAAGAPPNPAYWRSEDRPWPYSNELQYYSPNNAFHDGQGNLVIETRREAVPGKMCHFVNGVGTEPCQYTSARLWTEGLVTASFGRVESRIKVAGGKGMWPTIWMMGDNGKPWPDRGEIDIMEHLGSEPNISHGGVHGPRTGGGQETSVGGHYTAPAGTDFAAGFHTYAVDWNPQRFIFYIDGVAWQTLDRATVTKDGPWAYDGPFYILLNTAVGGWAGPPDGSTVFPAKMLIDWVRIS